MKKIAIMAICGMALLIVNSGCMGKPKNLFSISNDGGKRVECKGKEISRNLPITDFHAIEAKGYVDIEYTTGPAKGTLTAPEDAMQYIDVKVKDGSLTVSIVDNVNLKDKNNRRPKLCLKVSSSALDNINLLGACDITTGDLSGNEIKVNLMGAGDIKTGKLNAETVKMTTMGAGDIEIQGMEGKDLTLHTSGAGDITVKNIKTFNVTASISGAGDITLNGICKNADLYISGVGDINARGLTAGSWNTKTSGVGEIKK